MMLTRQRLLRGYQRPRTTSVATSARPLRISRSTDIATATNAQLFAVTDKIVDRINNDALGYVTLRNGEVFVTERKGLGAIQRAVNAASGGATIQIEDGSYPETNLTVDKQVDFVGESRAGTVIGPLAGVVEQNIMTLNDASDGTTFTDLSVNSRAQYAAAIQSDAAATSVDAIAFDNVALAGLGPASAPQGANAGILAASPTDGWSLTGIEDRGLQYRTRLPDGKRHQRDRRQLRVHRQQVRHLHEP